jgi:2'-5' RNA ligase
MAALEGARWRNDERLHLTLRLVGEVEREVANDLAAASATIASPPVELGLRGVSHFERKGIPTAVWTQVPLAPGLERLRAKIGQACDLVGLGRETRRFTPHVTIARLTCHGPDRRLARARRRRAMGGS